MRTVRRSRLSWSPPFDAARCRPLCWNGKWACCACPVVSDASGFAGSPEVPTRRGSIPHLHKAPGRVLERLELAGAGHARRHFLRAELLEPGEPIRPPGARVFLGLRDPFVHVGIRGRLWSVPVLIL